MFTRQTTSILILATLTQCQTTTDHHTSFTRSSTDVPSHKSETEKLHALLASEQYDGTIRPDAIKGTTTVDPGVSRGTFTQGPTATDPSNVSGISDAEKLQAQLKHYDGQIRPGSIHGKPTVVYLDFLIVRLSSFKETEMEYEATMYFRQTWQDFRLADPTRNESVALSYATFSKLWVPDTFFSNEKAAFIHVVTVPNRLLMVDPQGMVLYSQKLTARLGCEFLLRKFPHDSQVCKIVIESYGYTDKDIVFEWKNVPRPVGVSNVSIPEFTLTNHSVSDCSVSYVTGTFSCKQAALYLTRDLGYYMTRVFAPSILIVGLSWVSFWIDYHSVPARISLGLLTVLSIITQSSSIANRLPAVSYIKAYDVWMAVCLFFVFAALVEYSVVSVLDRTGPEAKEKKKKYQLQTPNCKKAEESMEEVNVSISGSEASDSSCRRCFTALFGTRNKAEQADKVSRVLFPMLFLIFNICYWTVYYLIDD